MTIALEKSDTISKQLYDILISRDFDVTATDLFGKPVMDPSEVNVFSFNYKTENKSYGHVVIALDSNDNLEIMFSGNMANSMEREDRSGWYDFLQLIRNFAKRNMLKFGAKDISKMKYTMQGIAASMNESTLVESYYGNKHTSFADLPESTKLVIKHNKSIGEGDLRYRHIESIFIETADGERFKVPSKSLAEAKALARHVAEGGKPYDRFGKYISEMADECRLLSKLKRKYKGAAELNEDEQDMVNTGLARFDSLRKNLKKCAAKKGYGEIKESFIAATTDHKVKESTMKKQMRELELFENWATSILESIWVMPDTPGRQEELVQLLQGGLTVGPDATNAVNAIADLLGDRELHDRLEKVAANDPDADAVPTIVGWMEENSQHASINAVLSSLSGESDQPPAEEPPMPDEEPEPEMPADDMQQEPEQAMPAEPRRESKQNKKRKVECHVKPFAKRIVEHDGCKVEAMVFETTMHARQYVKANPKTEHLFTDDVGAYVATIIENYEWADLHPEMFDRNYLKENIGDSLDYSLMDELEEQSKQYSAGIEGNSYVYMSIMVSPIHKYINIARFAKPQPLLRSSNNYYIFEVDGAKKKYPATLNNVKVSFLFDSVNESEKFLSWLSLKADGATIETKLLDSGAAGELGEESLDSLVREYDEADAYGRTGEEHECGACGGSGTEYGETCVTCGGSGHVRDESEVNEDDNDMIISPPHDPDAEDYNVSPYDDVSNEFYVAIYDEDDNTTFIGGVKNDGGRDGWREFRVAGEAPYNWGSGNFMGYLTPQDVMHWLHKDYGRGYEIKGPFFSKEEALQWARQNFGSMEEDRNTQAYIELGGELAQKKPMQAKKFNGITQWQAAIKKHSPWVDFVKKGEVVFAKMGPHILGDFDLSQRRGEIFAESKKAKKSVK